MLKDKKNLTDVYLNVAYTTLLSNGLMLMFMMWGTALALMAQTVVAIMSVNN